MSADHDFSIIKMQLIDNFLSAAVDEMMQAVVRTSLSPITREVFDFQCGIVALMVKFFWRVRVHIFIRLSIKP